MVRTHLYCIWDSMKRRCEKPNMQNYKYYGAKGVRVCDSWHDFTIFRQWAESHGYKDGLSIDRIDSVGDYEPSNCRWVTKGQNSREAVQVMLDVDGESHNISDWAEKLGVSHMDWQILGEGLLELELLASLHPKSAGPREGDVGFDLSGAEDEIDLFVIDVVGTLLTFSELLAQELAFEQSVFEGTNHVDVIFSYGLAFVPDGHRDVHCRIGAVVGYREGRALLVELEPPVVDRLVRSDGKRPLADRVRVATYLVRLGCKAVGLGCDSFGVFGDPVGFLGEGVRVLGELVRLARLDDGDAGGHDSEGTCHGSNYSDDHAQRHIVITSDSCLYKKNAAAGTCGGDKESR